MKGPSKFQLTSDLKGRYSLDEDTGCRLKNGVLHVGPGRTGRVLRDAEIQGLGAAPPELG